MERNTASRFIGLAAFFACMFLGWAIGQAFGLGGYVPLVFAVYGGVIGWVVAMAIIDRRIDRQRKQ